MSGWIKATAFLFVFMGAITVYSAWRLSVRDMPQGSEQAPTSWPKPPGYDEDILARWTLTECRGEPVKSEDLEGQVHVVSFFFATCPGSCNLQNTHLRAYANQYGPLGVKFLSITTDPEADSLKSLQEYAARFQAHPDHWYFLRSPDMEYIERIGAEVYRVHVGKKVHMDRFVLVDKWGNLRYFCDWKSEDARKELHSKIQQLLDETEEPAHFAGPDDAPRRPPGYEDELEEQAEEAAEAAAKEQSEDGEQ